MGQVWGTSPFHPAFPFVLKEMTPLTWSEWLSVSWYRQAFPGTSGLTLSSHTEARAQLSLCLFHCTPQPWLHRQGKEKERTGQQKADSCPCHLEEGQKFEKWGEKGGCSSERWVVLASLGGSSTAVTRKGGNKLLGTRRMKDQPTEISYNRY